MKEKIEVPHLTDEQLRQLSMKLEKVAEAWIVALKQTAQTIMQQWVQAWEMLPESVKREIMREG